MDGDPAQETPRLPPRRKGARQGRQKQLPWREDVEILARLPLVERHHLGGKSNRRIATLLGVDESVIRDDLGRLRELWLERIGAAQEHLKAEKVAELRDVQFRAIEAAEFDERAERAVLYGADADGTPIHVQRDAKGSAQFRGNKAAALAQARQAIMDQAKVLELIVDRQEQVGGDDGTGEEQRTLRIIALLDAARARAAHGGGDPGAPAPADGGGAGGA